MDTRTPTTSRDRRGADHARAKSRPLGDSVRRRPLTWFFSLAFLLSWVGWTPYVLSLNGLGVWDFAFPVIGGTTQFLGVLPGAYLGPIMSAFLVTTVTEGRAGVRAWAGRLTKWRVGWRWYAAIVLAVPVVLVLASVVIGGRAPVLPSAAVMAAYLPGLLVQLVTTGLAEEPGWREFAMPRLQRRHGPLKATAVIGPVWGAWHLPLFLTDWGGPHVTWLTPVEFIATTIAFSAVMTWAFNRTMESLPLVMLLHCGVNNYFSLAWEDMFPGGSHAVMEHAFLLSSVAAALVLLIATRGRLGCPPPPSEGVRAAA